MYSLFLNWVSDVSDANVQGLESTYGILHLSGSKQRTNQLGFVSASEITQPQAANDTSAQQTCKKTRCKGRLMHTMTALQSWTMKSPGMETPRCSMASQELKDVPSFWTQKIERAVRGLAVQQYSHKRTIWRPAYVTNLCCTVLTANIVAVQSYQAAKHNC